MRLSALAAIGVATAAALAAAETGSVYDAKVDGLEQLETASAAAKVDGRRILVIVGGNW
ncbi:MAG: hypothetical protein ACOY3Y_00790 [Acidobacteriota bacterium]